MFSRVGGVRYLNFGKLQKLKDISDEEEPPCN